MLKILLRNDDPAEIIRFAVAVAYYEASRFKEYIGSVRFPGAVTDGVQYGIPFQNGIHHFQIPVQILRMDILFPDFFYLVHIFRGETEIIDQGK